MNSRVNSRKEEKEDNIAIAQSLTQMNDDMIDYQKAINEKVEPQRKKKENNIVVAQS